MVEEETKRDADVLLKRLVASVAAIPDPIERAMECVHIGDGIRNLHAQLAEVRRRAIYEATLKPGATGRSVATELGVSGKTVSQASAEFRRQDLEMLHELVEAAKAHLPENADLEHAQAMLASSSAVGVLAHVVAKLSTPWHIAEKIDDGEDDAWWKIHDGFERAEYLSKLAGLERTPRIRSVDDAAEPDEHTPLELRWLCRLLNAMPGIHSFGSTDRTEGRTVWTVWWSVGSADRHMDTFSAGPSREGWLVSEWLVWLVRDYRKAGKEIESRVTAPPPMINEPGSMLTFAIEADLDGPNAVDPHEFGRSIVRLWDGEAGRFPGSGYFEIEWPPEGPR